MFGAPDARSGDLLVPIEIEDRQRSKSMVPAVTNFQQEPEPVVSSQDTIESPKKKKEELVEIEESDSSIGKSSNSSTPIPTPKLQKPMISPLKQKVSAIANFRGNQNSKKGSLLEEILKKQGQEEDSSMMMELMKDDFNGKRSLPVRTMSVDFNPLHDHYQKLPRLLAKPRPRKNDIHKRTNQKAEHMRSLSPIKQHARNGASPLEELSLLQLEKEKSYQALLERSLGLYKPVTQVKQNSLQSFRAFNNKMKKAKANRLSSGSFEVDTLKSDERGYDLVRGDSNNISYVDFVVDSATTDTAWKSTREYNPSINIERLDRMHSNLKGTQSSVISLQSSGLDFEEQLTGKAKTAQQDKSAIGDKEVEALYTFLMHDRESAISKIALMQNILSNKAEDRKNQTALEKLEKEEKNSLILKNAETFKQAVKEWVSEHKISCGKECYHLQRFYEKIDFRKQFIDILLTKEKNTKKIMKIPLAVLAGPLPAESADLNTTGRKRYKGVI